MASKFLLRHNQKFHLKTNTPLCWLQLFPLWLSIPLEAKQIILYRRRGQGLGSSQPHLASQPHQQLPMADMACSIKGLTSISLKVQEVVWSYYTNVV